jgi:hypothetical protein
MARRSPPPARIVRAQLDGTARNLLRRKVDRAEARAELHKITTDAELLGRAAGSALGAWRSDPVRGHDGDRVAGLLIEAGGDAAAMEDEAKIVQARHARERSSPGIGNPSPSRPLLPGA